MARLLVVVAGLLLSLCTYSKGPGEIDPAKIEIHKCSADGIGSLTYEGDVILTFPAHDRVEIKNTVNSARTNNCYLIFEDISQENPFVQEPILVRNMRSGSPILSDTWIKISPNEIETHKKSLLREFPYIKYKLLGETFEINLYFEEVRQFLLSTIAEARRNKVVIQLNLTALSNPKKQQFLRGTNLAILLYQ